MALLGMPENDSGRRSRRNHEINGLRAINEKSRLVAIVLIPFVVPGLSQPQTQYLAGVMVLVAGVLAFWGAHLTRLATERNDLREHHREMETSLRNRFTSVADQLSNSKSGIRQSGAYALAALSNDWARYGKETGNTSLGNAERQVCIDILCAYLRNPARNQKTGEHEVRQTVIDRIRIFTLLGESQHLSWAGNTFNLSGASLASAKLKHADLSGADLSHADLSGANLARSHLSSTNLVKTTLVGANLIGANLSKSDLSGANLTDAKLTESDLTDITWNDETIWPSGFQPPNLLH